DPSDAPGTARLAAEKLEPDFKRPFTADDWDLVMAGTGVGTKFDEHVSENATVIATSGIAAWAQWHLWHLHLELEAGIYDPADLKAASNDDGDDDDEVQRRAIVGKLFG